MMRNAVLGALAAAAVFGALEWRHRQAAEALTLSFNSKLAELAEKQAQALPAAVGSGAGSAVRASARPSFVREMPDPALERQKAERIVAKVQALMDAETRDGAWANAVEAWISSTYGPSFLASSRLEKVECKETLCVVYAIHKNDEAYQRWLPKFNGYEKGLPQMMTMPTVQADGTTRTKTFLLKSGHQFPPPDK
jgi:hypothetical protein